jgi:hypothetical protein
MNKLVEDKGVNALPTFSGEAFCLPGHEWPGYGSRWLKQSVGWYVDLVIWRSDHQRSLARRSESLDYAPLSFVARCFSAGIQNAPEPNPAEGVYALATTGTRNNKGRKRPPTQRAVASQNPGVNARATQLLCVNVRAVETRCLRHGLENC